MNKIKNKRIKVLEQQFNTILEILKKEKIVIDSIPPKFDDFSFTSQNKVKSIEGKPSSISSKMFNTVENYLSVFQNRAYHFFLFDGSLIKLNFEFDESYALKTYNLSWLPCVFTSEYINMFEIKDNQMNIFELYNELDSYELSSKEKICLSDICLRSPIRIDFDSTYSDFSRTTHPLTHMHFQSKNTRLKIENTFCIYRFVAFVLENCYPDEYFIKKKRKNRGDEDNGFITDDLFNELKINKEEYLGNTIKKWDVESRFSININF